ncbi:MAG TPA: hypothetical protein VFX02_07535 [Gammaproteobacteria bacterium]|nr:hypothetical protein [Gammaproteobacteria bacterium]
MNAPWISTHKALAPILWKAANRIFLCYDVGYRILHRLYPVDDFLYLKISRYRGEFRIFADGTAVHNGDPIGIIHFNNHYLAGVHASGGGRRAAYAFGYALLESMRNLALELERNPSFRELRIISGVTWFKTHGNKIGFESEPLPEGRHKRLLTKHFRVLLYAMFPHLAKREGARLEPHRFWLTRNRLFESINARDNHAAQRFSREPRSTPEPAPGARRHFSDTGVFEK